MSIKSFKDLDIALSPKELFRRDIKQLYELLVHEGSMRKITEKSFNVMFKEILLEKDIKSEEDFCEKCSLPRDIYYRWAKEGYIPSMRNLVAFAIECGLSYEVTLSLLHSLGLGFKTANWIHLCYQFVIIYFSGCPISQVNYLLKEFGLDDKDLLGNKDIYIE